MSAPSSSDPRLDQAAASDETLLASHEKLLGKQPDEKARYKLLPLNLLFFFSALIFFAGTYLNRYSGLFDPTIYNENNLPSSGAPVAVAVDPLVLGKKQYEAVCITCHMANGQGTPGVYPPLAESEWVIGSEERLARLVLYGLKGPITVKGVVYNGAAMPAIGRVPGSGFNLSDDKIAAVLTYIRQQWGNNAPPITTERVAAIHAKEGARKEFTAEELATHP